MNKSNGPVSTGERWEHFHHGADIGVRGIAYDKGEAFALAALALTAVITDPQSVRQDIQVSIECRAPDDEILLVDWLNAVIYEMATQSIIFGHFHVNINDGQLKAVALGEKLDRERHQPVVEVKGATFTELKVEQNTERDWIAQCVVDV